MAHIERTAAKMSMTAKGRGPVDSCVSARNRREKPG